MKIWLHIISGFVGVLIAGLIVFIVFGTASREGATQDGDAPTELATSASLCGRVPPAQTSTAANLAKADDNLPSIIDPTGRPIGGFATPAQQQWLRRVVAAGGFCLDEISFEQADLIKLSLSTVEGMSQADAAAFTGAALVAAFDEPLYRRTARITTYVGDTKRSIFMSTRGADAFEQWRRTTRAGTSATDVVRFSRTVRLGTGNLQVLGWS